MDKEITLLFAGDFIPPEKENNVFSKGLLTILQNKDFSLVNLETPLTKSNAAIQKNGNNFKRSPQTIQHVKNGYFDSVGLSNNHIRDFGDEGVLDTLRICHENNIQTVGAGKNSNDARKPLRINIKEKKIAILNYSEREFNNASKIKAGANPYETISSYYDIQKEKKENDYVIVIYHGGVEYQYYPTPEIVNKFKFMVDVGADAVVSHHTHRYSGSMVYKEKPLLFGLGNFLSPTKSKISNVWLEGLLAIVNLNGNSIGFELVPVVMSTDFSKVDLVDESKSEKIRSHLLDISAIIKQENKLTDYWIEIDNLEKDRVIQLLKSDSKLEYRMRKYFPKLFLRNISNYKKKMLLNLIRCDSHRNRLVRILENL